MAPLDVYRAALAALLVEPSAAISRLPWDGRQAQIRATTRKMLRDAIAEEEAIGSFVRAMVAVAPTEGGAEMIECQGCSAIVTGKPYTDSFGRDFCNESCSDAKNEQAAERIHERGF